MNMEHLMGNLFLTTTVCSLGTYGESDDDKYVIDSDDDDFPEKCPICRRGFTNPVVTRCKHYFCEKCAVGRCPAALVSRIKWSMVLLTRNQVV